MQLPIKKSIEKVPGGMMVVPLLLGALINTFAPEFFKIGGFTTALFKNGALPLIGMFLFCMGAQMNFNIAPVALKKGIILTGGKYAIGVAIGLGVAMFVPGGVLLGLTPLALIAAITNSNGGLYVSLTAEYGDESDVGAISVLSLNDGLFFTMIALGLSGLASIPFTAFLAVLIPIAIGMIIGNLDEEMRKFLGLGERVLIPFFAFSLGAGMDFFTIFKAGASGIILGVVTVLATGLGGYFLLRLFGYKNAIAGAAEGSVAGNAVATPAAIAAIDASYKPIMNDATAQVAAACIITALLCPALVVFMNKLQESKGIYKPKKVPVAAD